MPVDTNPPSDADIEKWFITSKEPEAGTFEFALVLGGTVSAGSYTAGAVDFLIQALDCLTAAQKRGDVPQHTVRLKLIAGTSGGGVNAAIAARALAFHYPHVTPQTVIDPAQNTGNPFYETWVRKLQLSEFLKINDIGPDMASLLNGKPIDDAGDAIAGFTSGPVVKRDWVAEPLRLILTLTSLRGVPYKTHFREYSQGYVDHADYARFAILYPGQTMGEKRPDEFALGFGQPSVPAPIEWLRFAEFAKATAAFPLGFPPRLLERPAEHYRWRVVAYPPEPSVKPDWRFILPDWQGMAGDGGVPENWRFLAVDGGATDNEPIQLARNALSGLLTHAPRTAETANRAVWLIDPFAGRAPLGPDKGVSFAQEFGAIVSTLTQQTRYDTADLLMAADDDQYSRFMLTPTRKPDKVGEDAIASGGLGAFIGFACPAFMHHDYMLGRQNCWQFLKQSFELSPDNKVFAGWKKEQMAPFLIDTPMGGRGMPIIPLVGAAAQEPSVPDWPAGELHPEDYRDAMEARFSKITETQLSGSWFRSVLAMVAAHAGQGPVADLVIKNMQAYLEAAQLD